MAEATNSVLGEIKLAGDLAGDGGAQLGSVPQLTHISGLTPGQYNIANITVDSKGRVVAIESASTTAITQAIPNATTTQKGKVQIGDNIYVTDAQTKAYQIVNFGGTLTNDTLTSLCSTQTHSVVINVNGSGFTYSALGSTISTIGTLIASINSSLGTVLTASLSSGNIKLESTIEGSSSSIDVITYCGTDQLFSQITSFIGFQTSIDGTGSCEIYVKNASTTDCGVVQIGDGLSVLDGVISVDLSTPIASATELGLAKFPTSGNLTIDVSGNVSVPKATASVLGVVKSGTGTSIAGDGTLSIDPSSMKATASVLGTVKVPSSGNLTIDGAGNIGVPIANTTQKGVVKAGTGTTIDVSGSLSVPIATTTTVGLIKVGSGLSITGDGVLSAPGGAPGDASYVAKGIVQIDPTYLTVASGVLSVPAATTSALGVVQIATSDYMTIASGVVSLSSLVAKTDVAQTFTKAQAVALGSLSGSSVTPNLALANAHSWTLSANSTLNNPTNIVAGGTYLFTVTQDATGSRLLSFGTAYKFPGGTPVVSTAANITDVISCVSDGTNMYCTITKGF